MSVIEPCANSMAFIKIGQFRPIQNLSYMRKQLKMKLHRKHSHSNNSPFSPSFIYLLLTIQKQNTHTFCDTESKPSGGARNHKPAQHIHQEMGITATMATRSHPTNNKSTLRVAMLSPLLPDKRKSAEMLCLC